MMNDSNASPQTASVALLLNGEEIQSLAPTLVDLLIEQGLDPAQPGIAVALNDSVVPRSAWAEQPIEAGDRVELITAMQGG